MDNQFEKVEKLRERANVTYEEARDALNEANGDLLDAMVLLFFGNALDIGKNNNADGIRLTAAARADTIGIK